MLWILGIILLIVFIPIPIKANLVYEDNKFFVSLYKFRINITGKRKAAKIATRKSRFYDFLRKKYKVSIGDIREMISIFSNLRFKPSLRISLRLVYGLGDAAYTANTYGPLYSISPAIYKSLTIPFNVKRYSLDIAPNFEKMVVNGEADSIIFVNLAKIIYISIILLKFMKKIKKTSS